MSQKVLKPSLCFSVLALIAILFAATALAQTSASLNGTVQDPKGGVIPGATVKLTNTAGTTQLETTTNESGYYSFPIIQPGTYIVTVEATGFKKTVKSGIVVNASDKQTTGVIVLEVGDISTSVEVVASPAQLTIKTESGEVGTAIVNRELQDLALNGRNYLDLLKLTPGVVVTTGFAVSGPGGFGNIDINGARTGKNNLTIDGTTNVDTGSNGTQHIALSLDNISEFKMLTSNYQAEFGRSGGGAIQIVTKSGTSQFHGTGFFYHRHEQFNANSFFNNGQGRRADGTEISPRNFYRYNQAGYNIGGPVKIGKYLSEHLFFFWSQEWQEQLVPQNARSSRVPTALEAAGDFSQTHDGNGVDIVIKDPLTGQPFDGNKIPTSRINPNGAKILNLFRKFENLPLGGAVNAYRYNHYSQQSVSYPRRENSIRVDWNVSNKTKAYARYTRDSDQQVMPYGLGWTGGSNQIPFDNLVFKQGPAFNGTLNVTTAVSSTLINEFIFGLSQNNLTLNPTVANAASYSGIGFDFKLPFAGYPAGQWFNINFGGTPNQNFAGTNGYSAYPYKNSNTTFDIYDNISKVWSTHTFKAGFYYQRSRKDQAAGDSAYIQFNHDVNDPNNSGHPYANALLGNFNTFREPNIGVFQGQYRSTNVEWYAQDNWKVNSRLTLDMGMRFSLIYPQFDKRQQDYVWVASKYDRAKSVRLYYPTCAAGTFALGGCSSANQRAYDPQNPSVLLPAYLVGRIVPNSGDPFNGMTGSKDGYYPGSIKSRGVQYGPAVGFAYDVFGNKKTVLRGGYRLGFDRVQGNELAFAAVGQPPLFYNPTFYYGNLSTVGQSTGAIALGTSGVIAADPEGFVPSVQSWSLQVQQDVGWNMVVSAGYVGTLSRHQQELVNLNYIPYGALFQKSSQDPSKYPNGVVPDEEPNLPQMYKDAGFKFSGQYAFAQDFLRRVPGYNTIGLRTFGGSSNYHSLQMTASKRFSNNFNFGMSYTYSKALGTANSYGDYINPVCSRCADYRRLDFDRTHYMVINYDYRVHGLKNAHWLLKGVTNGWQITGITQFQSGQPVDAGAGISNINLNQRLGGSWTESTRSYFTSDPNATKERYKYFNWETINLPTVAQAVAAKGAWSRNFLSRPGIAVTDLSLFKNFQLGGDSSRNLQLRLETFNVFNHPQFNSMNTSVTWNSFNAYLTSQSAATANINNVRGKTLSGSPPQGNGVGEINGLTGNVAGNRVVQLAVKIFF